MTIYFLKLPDCSRMVTPDLSKYNSVSRRTGDSPCDLSMGSEVTGQGHREQGQGRSGGEILQ